MNFQSKCLEIGKYGCLYLCYTRLAGASPEKALENFDALKTFGALGENCYVNNADEIFKLYGKLGTVKKSYTNPKKGNQVAYFKSIKFPDNGHFVIVDDNDNIVWNSLDGDKSPYTTPGVGEITSYRYLDEV